MVDDLIYDVGVNDGDDSAYYLARGFRVVGIEASPVLTESIEQRFRQEIYDGRYTLLSIGIASQAGTAEFWLSDISAWSSFDRGIASRDGTPHRAIQIPTVEFSSILEQYGVPFYCKIDIEGNDRYCIEKLTPSTCPRYISIEMGYEGADADIGRLAQLGYSKFKIVSQVTRMAASPIISTGLSRLSGLPKRAVGYAFRNTLGVTSAHGWQFSRGSSGPFAEDTPGKWTSCDQAIRTWQTLRDIDARTNGNGLAEYFDIHAAR